MTNAIDRHTESTGNKIPLSFKRFSILINCSRSSQLTWLTFWRHPWCKRKVVFCVCEKPASLHYCTLYTPRQDWYNWVCTPQISKPDNGSVLPRPPCQYFFPYVYPSYCIHVCTLCPIKTTLTSDAITSTYVNRFWQLWAEMLRREYAIKKLSVHYLGKYEPRKLHTFILHLLMSRYMSWCNKREQLQYQNTR